MLGNELKQILSQYTAEEIVAALYEDVADPYMLHKALGDASTKLCAEACQPLISAACKELADYATKNRHYCGAIIKGLDIIQSTPMPKEELDKFVAEGKTHVDNEVRDGFFVTKEEAEQAMRKTSDLADKLGLGGSGMDLGKMLGSLLGGIGGMESGAMLPPGSKNVPDDDGEEVNVPDSFLHGWDNEDD